MANNRFGKGFFKKAFDDAFYIFSILCVVNYLTTSIDNKNYYFLWLISLSLAVGFVISYFKINIGNDKKESTKP